MPVRSMTGYGRGVATAGGLRVEIRATSINRKQLDVQVNLAREFAELEPRLQAAVRGALSRGRITLLVDVVRSAAVRRQEVRVDEDLAAAYHAALQKATRRLGLPDNVDATFLMGLPEVVQLSPPAQELERVWAVAQRALAAALKALVAMRTREGAALRCDIETRLAGLEKRVTQIAAFAPEVSRRYREQLLARLREAGQGDLAADERVIREVALFADKADITEELTRLRSHFGQVRALLDGREPPGRALDFLAQEMFREINTIGSKANATAISHVVVGFKAELEQIREQVQNLE
jgi:uncharacterized protein (TIGR00255 family)